MFLEKTIIKYDSYNDVTLITLFKRNPAVIKCWCLNSKQILEINKIIANDANIKLEKKLNSLIFSKNFHIFINISIEKIFSNYKSLKLDDFKSNESKVSSNIFTFILDESLNLQNEIPNTLEFKISSKILNIFWKTSSINNYLWNLKKYKEKRNLKINNKTGELFKQKPEFKLKELQFKQKIQPTPKIESGIKFI
jgi:hypothetical protein